MKDKTKIFLDLSKLSEEQIKQLPMIILNNGFNLAPESFQYIQTGKFEMNYPILGLTLSDKKLFVLFGKEDLINETELTYTQFIEMMEGETSAEKTEKKVKISFGLEAQGHIPAIEGELKRWNDSFNIDYPDHKIKDTMTYSKDVWEDIGKKISWCPFTASLAYFKWIESNKVLQVENDGWIKIESESDIPDKEGLYFTFSKVSWSPYYRIDVFTGRLRNSFTDGKSCFTHYQPIQKPEPPKILTNKTT